MKIKMNLDKNVEMRRILLMLIIMVLNRNLTSTSGNKQTIKRQEKDILVVDVLLPRWR